MPRTLLSIATAVAVAVVTGCGGSPSEEASPPTETIPTTTPPAVERPKASPLTGTSLNGERISLEGFRGRPVLVNVWSSW